MARIQRIIQSAEITLANPGDSVPLTPDETFTKSFLIQASIENTDYLKIGDANSRNISLAPGQFYSYEPDALDHGGGGKIDLSRVFVETIAAGQKFVFEYSGGI